MIALSLVGAMSYAQTTVTGKVVDNNDQPVIGANVILYRLDGDMYRAGATNVDGLFEFKGINAGTYDLVISSIFKIIVSFKRTLSIKVRLRWF